MTAYQRLAQCYDRLTNDVDYDATVAFYWEILKREGLSPRTAVDLACGTGSVAIRLAQMGLDVVAVDMSEDMLCQASQKAQELKNPPNQQYARIYDRILELCPITLKMTCDSRRAVKAKEKRELARRILGVQ